MGVPVDHALHRALRDAVHLLHAIHHLLHLILHGRHHAFGQILGHALRPSQRVLAGHLLRCFLVHCLHLVHCLLDFRHAAEPCALAALVGIRLSHPAHQVLHHLQAHAVQTVPGLDCFFRFFHFFFLRFLFVCIVCFAFIARQISLHFRRDPVKHFFYHVCRPLFIGNQPEIRYFVEKLHRFHGECLAFDLAPADLIQVDLSVCVARQLVCDHDAARDALGLQRLFGYKHLPERAADHVCGRVSSFERFHAEHGYIVVRRLDIHRNHAAALNPRLAGDLCLDTARFVLSPFLVDEVAVGPAEEGKLSVFLHPGVIVGADIRLSLDVLVIDDLSAVELGRSQRRRIQIQNPLARRVLRVKIHAALFVQKPDLHPREGPADRLVVQIRRGQAAGPAELGYAVPVEKRHLARSVLAQEFVKSVLIRRGYRSASEHHIPQAGKVRAFVLGHLHPAFKHGADGEQKGDSVMRYGFMEPRVEHAARSERHGRPHGKGKMHLIDDAVGIAQIDNHRG